MFEQANWIWTNTDFGENEYGEFYQNISWKQGKTTLTVSVRGDYTLFVNGVFVASNQYADFEHYKIYDEIDVTPYLTQGDNSIGILVWYFGKSGMRYLTPDPGLLYEINQDGITVAYSGEHTLSRKSIAYQNDFLQKVSPQLGYSFCYDATREDGWLEGTLQHFTPSVILPGEKILLPRPIEKHQLLPIIKGTVLRTKPTLLLDLGEEVVGPCSLSFTSEQEQTLIVGYGELLENGHVKRLLPGRDFSFTYKAKKGKNEYNNYMFRLACRYIEIEYEVPLTLTFAGILPQVYPVAEAKWRPSHPLDKQIYEICLNTLKLCMMEHYVDCPWREQCLYAFDSRNQILAGYYAFSDKNLAYAKSNLLLMSKDERADNLLSICFPSGEDLTIPSFSLYYIIAVREYLQHSGDFSFTEQVFPKLTSILTAFYQHSEQGLLYKFIGNNHWNFYDWSPYASGDLKHSEPYEPDFLVNCIAILALNSYDQICIAIGKENQYQEFAEQLKEHTKKHFWNETTELFFISSPEEEPTELANSLSVLAGLAPDPKRTCEQLASGQLVPCSLSMKCFKYDALLQTDKERYESVILKEIRNTYQTMLDQGSTTVWEMAEGHTAFQNAGSLCHGWSAIPIYYYHILSK